MLVVELAGRMVDAMPEAAVEEAGLTLVGLRDDLHDVAAARATGAHLVAVATGVVSAAELHASTGGSRRPRGPLRGGAVFRSGHPGEPRRGPLHAQRSHRVGRIVGPDTGEL